jgi:hypothetical protein
MSVKIEAYGTACDDCVIAIANDDYTGMDDQRATEVASALEAIGRYLIVGDELGCMAGGCDVCGWMGYGNMHIVLAEEVA